MTMHALGGFRASDLPPALLGAIAGCMAINTQHVTHMESVLHRYDLLEVLCKSLGAVANGKYKPATQEQEEAV
jgi:hypothetical protein